MPDGIIISGFPVVIKAKKDGDRRLIEVEASNEHVDSEGDVILQRALLDSADYFVKSGNIDIDHISELGARLGIPDPASYVIGKPLEVKDLGKGRTGVVAEIRRALDGTIDVKKNRYDEFWESMQTIPPVVWQASIYGFPKSDQVKNCKTETCSTGATRFEVSGMEWRSLAMTRNPINTSLKGHAKIVTAKAFIDEIAKNYPFGPEMQTPMVEWKSIPRDLDHLWGQYIRHIGKDCPFAGAEGKSRACFKDHFTNCCGADPASADILAHALSQMIHDDRKKNS